MNNRKADVSPTGPRQRAKPDQLYDALNSQTSNANTAAASPSLATSQSRENWKRVNDCTTIDTLAQGTGAIHGAKRAKTQSPGKMIDYRTIPGFQPWPSVDDDPQSELKYWEDECYIKDLTEEKKLFREYSMMSEMGYYKCTCGKYHHVIGRKSYRYEDGTPEPGSGSELGQTEARARSVANSAYESRDQDLLPSPGLSDGEADAGDDPREPLPIDVQVYRAYSSAPTTPEASASPTSPAITICKARVLRRPSAKRSIEQLVRQRQTHEKMKKMDKMSMKGKNKKVKKNTEFNLPLVAEEPKYSSRSSRRDPGSLLWFLGDNGKACLVTAPSR